jgi:hypothetical protein
MEVDEKVYLWLELCSCRLVANDMERWWNSR